MKGRKGRLAAPGRRERMPASPDRYRVGFDIGGTFTDFVLSTRRTGEFRLHKCLTRPTIRRSGSLAGPGGAPGGGGHGDWGHRARSCTARRWSTNALIERSGARLGLLTTRGFRDILEMGTEQRYDITTSYSAFPSPWCRASASRGDRAHEPGRRGHDALDLEQAGREVALLVAGGSRRSRSASSTPTEPGPRGGGRDADQRRYPEFSCRSRREPCSRSSRVRPDIDDSANAYVQPLMDGTSSGWWRPSASRASAADST